MLISLSYSPKCDQVCEESLTFASLSGLDLLYSQGLFHIHPVVVSLAHATLVHAHRVFGTRELGLGILLRVAVSGSDAHRIVVVDRASLALAPE